MNAFDTAKAWFASWFDLNGLLNNLLAAFVWLVLGSAALALLYLAKRALFQVAFNAFWRVMIIQSVSMFLLFLSVGKLGDLPIFLTALGFMNFGVYWSLRGFISVGFVDAYRTTVGGLDYKSSLLMAKHSIDLLGIGAEKLSSLPEFDIAMEKCAAHGNNVRLLLSSPENPLLETMARRNQVDPNGYKIKVRESLRRIAGIKIQRDLNIEVRFYPSSSERDYQQFRLMFIDNQTCLLGWTVWGRHVGRHNPQVILRNKSGETSTAYKAFSDYFNAIWDDPETTRVNLADFNS